MKALGERAAELILLRWLVFLSASLVALHDVGVPVTPALPWVALLMAAAAMVHLLPGRLLCRPGIESVFLLADTLGIGLVLQAHGGPAGVAVLVALLGAALAGCLCPGMARAGLPGAGVAVLYAGFSTTSGVAGASGLLLLPTLTLIAATSVYAGELTGRAHARAREASGAHRESRELRCLLEITDAVTRTLNLHDVMQTIVDHVGEQVEADRCSILLVEGEGDNGFVVAASDNRDAEMLAIELRKYPEIRRAVETKAPVVIEDVESDPIVAPVRETLAQHGYRSLMVLPLVFGREVLGTLFLRASRSRPFTDSEVRFCKVAAGASANALKNALLYREISIEAGRNRETSEKLRRVLDCSPDMILATDTEGRIAEFNRGAAMIAGLEPAEATGKRVQEVLGPGAATAGISGRPAEGGRAELVLRTREGEDKLLSLVGAPLMGPDRTQLGAVWVGRDVTRQRRAEQSLIEAERLSSIGELAAGVAHELNNPLSAVLGYAQLVQSSGADSKLARDLQRIEASAKRCQRIVHNLLSFARQHRAEKRFADLNDCVRGVLELKGYHLRSGSVDLVADLDPELPKTLFDYHQMEQVALNLINNAEQAILYSSSSGRIAVRTRYRDAAVTLEVEDDGPGVAPGIRQRIFDPFFTTKDTGKGTGLGLAVSYGIVREHSGSIELVDGAGPGACFRVSIPRVEASEPRTASVDNEVPVAKGLFTGRRILVAEDEPEICQLLARVLREDGAEVTLSRDGMEAWERLAEADYDLIVADLRMPRLDGRRLYERTASERPELARRFVFATGDLVREDTLGFLERLPNRILAKPLDLETVRRVLHRALQPRPG